MADEIRQVLGFDVNDALTNLDRFGNAVSNVSGRLTRFGKNLDRFNQQFGTSASHLTQAGSATDRLGQSLERTERHVGRLTTSVELLSRIVFTQLVIKSLRIAEKTLFDAAQRAAELQIQLARIQTIAGTRFRGLGDIGEAVDSISTDLGIDQLDVAAGLYQSISNQVKGTRDELVEFNKIAGQFSVAALTSQEDAINLLSGTLNSFRLDVSRTEEIASKFNTTIELGRITGAELAHVLGRVDNQAALLGVSVDELLGAFATLTINNVNANEAATLLRGIFTGLTKATPELKRVLEELQVPSGQFLVQSQGLAEALRLISSRTDGSAAALAKLFPNIRGLNGELILGVQHADRFAANVEAIRNTAISLNRERFTIVFQTDAKNVEREINELRVAMSKLGKEILSVTAATFEYLGGADGIIKTGRLATPIVAGLGIEFLALKSSALLAAGGTSALGKSIGALMGRLAPLAVVAGATFAATRFGLETLQQRSLEGVRAIEAARKQATEEFKTNEQQRLRVARETDDAIIRSALQAAQKQVDAFNAAQSRLVIQESAFLSTAEQSLNRVVDLRTRLLREVEKAASDSTRVIEQSLNRVSDLRFAQDERRFNQRLSGLREPEQVSRLLGRSVQLARQASQDLLKAANEEQISRALKLFDSSFKTAESAQAIAGRTRNRQLENRAAATLNRLAEQQIQSEQRLQQLQDQRRQKSQKDIDAQRRVTDEVKAQTKIIADNLATVGQSPAEVAKRQRTVQEAFAKLTQTALSKSDVSLAESLGLTQLAAEIQRNLGSELKLNFDVTRSIEDLQARMQAAFSRFKLSVSFDVSALEKVLGKDFTSVDDISSGLEQAKKEADDLRTSISKALQDQFAQTVGARSQIRQLLAASDSLANKITRASSTSFVGSLTTDQFQRAERLLDAFRQQATTLTRQQQISEQDVKSLFGTLQELKTISDAGFGLDIQNFAEVVGLFHQIEQAGRLSTDEQEKRLRQLDAVIQSADAAGQKIEGGLIRGAERLEQAADRLINGLDRGRTQNFASGGLARGTDTVPAMLTRGEFVVNRSATQRFYSDLQRMNAGITPQFRSGGGSVDNSISVGDVHIHGSAPSITPRDVARAIGREVRRNTVRR